MIGTRITQQDVEQAAYEMGFGVLDALNLMQTAAAKMRDESTLLELCQIKNEILFGDNPK